MVACYAKEELTLHSKDEAKEILASQSNYIQLIKGLLSLILKGWHNFFMMFELLYQMFGKFIRLYLRRITNEG